MPGRPCVLVAVDRVTDRACARAGAGPQRMVEWRGWSSGLEHALRLRVESAFVLVVQDDRLFVARWDELRQLLVTELRRRPRCVPALFLLFRPPRRQTQIGQPRPDRQRPSVRADGDGSGCAGAGPQRRSGACDEWALRIRAEVG